MRLNRIEPGGIRGGPYRPDIVLSHIQLDVLVFVSRQVIHDKVDLRVLWITPAKPLKTRKYVF